MPTKLALDNKVAIYSRDYLVPAIAGTGLQEAFNLDASKTYTKGMPLVEKAGTPGTLTTGDGTAPVVGLMPFPATTDANGMITPGAAGAGSEVGAKLISVDVYIEGYFLKADVPGWSDANLANFGKAKGANLFKLI